MIKKVVKKQLNPRALGRTSRVTTAKSMKIAELENLYGANVGKGKNAKPNPNTPLGKFSQKAFREMVLAQAKLKQDAGDDRSWNDIVKGQEWYLEELQTWSKQSDVQRVEFEYAEAAHDTNSFDEIVANVGNIMAR